jgi:hypothetical protein
MECITGLQKIVPVSKAVIKPLSPANYFKVIIKIKYKEDYTCSYNCPKKLYKDMDFFITRTGNT